MKTSFFDVTLKQVKVKVRSALLQKFKILHISDLHIDTKTTFAEMKQLIERINSIECNIVVITGDIIDTRVKKVQDKLLHLKSIDHPTYYVSGNHDLVYGLDALKSLMKECGIELLDNRYTLIKEKEQHIILAGLGDRFSKFFNIKRNENKLVKNLQFINLPKIFLAHQPKDYKFALLANSDIFLCGHTHGGQIFPFHYFVKLVQPFLSGLHYVDSLAVYVSQGLGAWGIKYRFLSESELTLLELEQY
jgi:uncharacterized protein